MTAGAAPEYNLAEKPLGVALMLLALTFGPGCRSGSERFEGRWRGVRAEGVSADLMPAANAFAASTELDVKGDTLVVTTPKERQSGRYRVLVENATTLVIATDKDGPEQPQTFTFADGGTMKWAVIDGKSIVFARQ
jgi:hypothetical protein